MEMLALPTITPVVNVLGDAIVCGPEGFPDGGIIIPNAVVEEVYAVGAVFEYPGAGRGQTVNCKYR